MAHSLRPVKLFLIALLLLIVDIVGLLRWDNSSTAAEKAMEALPQVTTEEALQTAFTQPSQRYVVRLPLSGDGVYDRFHLLREACLELNYDCEAYESEINAADGTSSGGWVSVSGRSSADRSISILLPGGVPLDLTDVSLRYAKDFLLDETNCLLPEDVERCYYYPTGVSSSSTLRYRVSALPVGSEVLFLADIGPDGVQVSAPDGKQKLLLTSDQISDLAYYATESETGFLVLVLFPLFLVDIWLWIRGFRSLFTGA